MGYETEANERGERLIWLERAVVDRLRAMRGPGESFSDVILRSPPLRAFVRFSISRPLDPLAEKFLPGRGCQISMMLDDVVLRLSRGVTGSHGEIDRTLSEL